MPEENLISAPAGFIVEKDCLYVDHFNRIISALQSSGIMSHFFTRDVLLKWRYFTKPITTQKVLELRTYYSSLMFLGGMIAIAMVIFVYEVSLGKPRVLHEQKKIKVAKTGHL